MESPNATPRDPARPIIVDHRSPKNQSHAAAAEPLGVPVSQSQRGNRAVPGPGRWRHPCFEAADRRAAEQLTMSQPLEIAEIVVAAPAPLVEARDGTPKAGLGERLKAAREAKGLSHADVSNGVKLKIAHVIAIETGDRAALPAVPFAAGFVKAYAQFVGLDPEECARAYRVEAGAIAPKAEEIETPSPPARPAARLTSPALSASLAALPRELDRDKILSWLGVAAAVFCVLWIGASAIPRQPAKTSPDVADASSATAETAPAASASAESAPAAHTRQSATGSVVTPEMSDAVAAPGAALDAPAADSSQIEPEAAAATPVAPSIKPKPPASPAPVAATTPNDADPAISQTASSAVQEIEGAAQGPTNNSAAALAPSRNAASLGMSAPPAVGAPTIVAARLLRAPPPTYPERCARRAADEETVDVVLTVTAQGRPAGAAVMRSSNPCFNSAAIASVFDMRFSPRTVDGAPAVEAGKEVTIRFVR
jgi:TonB family protein